MGGAVERVPPGATAFAHRTAANLLWIINYWDDAQVEDQVHRDWVNGVHDATRAYSTGGGYVNALGHDDTPARVRAAYDEDTFVRLQQIKRRWDPDNIFRLNANIPPA